jgi:hypothetical protein
MAASKHDDTAPTRRTRRSREIVAKPLENASTADAYDLGRKRVIRRRFNVGVPRARVPKKASTRRERSER